MNPRVIIDPAADRDLDDQFDYIFYREVAGGIEVLRVLHAARDIEHILEAWQG